MADGTPIKQGARPVRGHHVALQFGWSRSLPMMLQTEAAECGLACLAMVASYHGHDVDLAGLRRKFSTSLKGVTLARVMTMASQLGFTCRPLKLDMDDLRQLKTPCLLHWDLNHFVVLKRVGKRRIVVHDPAYGIRKLSWKEVSEHFTGVALELSPSADFAPVRERQAVSLRALTGRVRGLVPALAQILLLALALEVFALTAPFYLQWVLDQVMVSAVHDDIAAMPMAYQSLVGDMGSSLSGGQKQRVILARALYRRPKVAPAMAQTGTTHEQRWLYPLDPDHGRAVQSVRVGRMGQIHQLRYAS